MKNDQLVIMENTELEQVVGGGSWMDYLLTPLLNKKQSK